MQITSACRLLFTNYGDGPSPRMHQQPCQWLLFSRSTLPWHMRSQLPHSRCCQDKHNVRWPNFCCRRSACVEQYHSLFMFSRFQKMFFTNFLDGLASCSTPEKSLLTRGRYDVACMKLKAIFVNKTYCSRQNIWITISTLFLIQTFLMVYTHRARWNTWDYACDTFN